MKYYYGEETKKHEARHVHALVRSEIVHAEFWSENLKGRDPL
jgi:hypothetical protein